MFIAELSWLEYRVVVSVTLDNNVSACALRKYCRSSTAPRGSGCGLPNAINITIVSLIASKTWYNILLYIIIDIRNSGFSILITLHLYEY